MRSKQRAPSNHNKHAPLSLDSHPLYHSCDLLKTFFFLSSGLSVLCLPCCLVARLSLALRRHRLLGVCCCGFFPLGFVLFLCSLFSVVFNFSEPGSFSWPLFLPILPFSLRFCWWYWFFVCLFLPSLLRISSPPFSVFVSFFFLFFIPPFLSPPNSAPRYFPEAKHWGGAVSYPTSATPPIPMSLPEPSATLRAVALGSLRYKRAEKPTALMWPEMAGLGLETLLFPSPVLACTFKPF